MKNIVNVIRIIVRELRLRYGSHINPSYSQDGEDQILQEIFIKVYMLTMTWQKKYILTGLFVFIFQKMNHFK